MLFLCSDWNEKKLAKICLLQCKSSQYLIENFNVSWNVETNYPQKRSRNPLIERTFILLKGKNIFPLGNGFSEGESFFVFFVKVFAWSSATKHSIYRDRRGYPAVKKFANLRQINAYQAIRERTFGYGVNQILHPEGAYIWNATLNFHTNFEKLANVWHEFSIQYFLVRDRLCLNWPPRKCYLKILACWKIN